MSLFKTKDKGCSQNNKVDSTDEKAAVCVCVCVCVWECVCGCGRVFELVFNVRLCHSYKRHSGDVKRDKNPAEEKGNHVCVAN